MSNESSSENLPAGPIAVYCITTDADGVVTSYAQSNIEQPGAHVVSAEVFADVVKRGGLAKFDGTTLTDYAPPAPPTPIPVSASRLGLMRALKEAGKWDAAKAAIASNADVQEEWDLAIEIKRTDPLTAGIVQALGLTSADVDQLLIRAAALTA